MDGVGSDLVLIDVQECKEINPRRTEGQQSRHIQHMGINHAQEGVHPAHHSSVKLWCNEVLWKQLENDEWYQPSI